LRDGDGNTVASTNDIIALWSRIYEPTTGRFKYTNPSFDSVSPGADGFSKLGTLSAIALVPEDILAMGDNAGEYSVYLSNNRGRIYLPVNFSVDPIFANNRTPDVFEEIATVRPKDVLITVQ